jgi:hypothetical protein
MVKRIEFHIFCLYFDEGLQWEDVQLLEPIYTNADQYLIAQPTGITVFFKVDSEIENRIQQFRENLEKHNDEKNNNFAVGESRGELIVDSYVNGKVESVPYGAALVQADKNARENYGQ